MSDYPLKDSEFNYIDNELYSIIQKTLDVNYSINEDPKLFNWYCEIRNKLCQDIHNKNKAMTELKQEHFEVIDKNKQKAREQQRDMRDQLAVFVLNCSVYELTRLYDEYKRLKKTSNYKRYSKKIFELCKRF